MRYLIFILLISLNCYSGIYDVPKVTTVQNRLYFLKNEFTLQSSFLPLDPFAKYIALGGSYSRHFSNFTSWEIFNANYASRYDAGLKKDLISGFKADPNGFDVLKYYLSSNLVLTPLYSKVLLFNSSIVYQMTSLVAGFGVGSYEYLGKTEFRNFVNVGAIMQFFLGRSTSIKLDFRDQIYLSGNRNHLTMTLGFALNYGTDESENKVIDEFQ